MADFEVITIDTMVAACNGGGGALGHPRVFLNLAPAGKAECPYCSRLFVHRAAGVEVDPAEVRGDTDKPDEPAPIGEPPPGPAVRGRRPQSGAPR